MIGRLQKRLLRDYYIKYGQFHNELFARVWILYLTSILSYKISLNSLFVGIQSLIRHTILVIQKNTFTHSLNPRLWSVEKNL